MMAIVCAYSSPSFTPRTITGTELNTDTGLSTSEENRIYGGAEADVRQHPYIVSLRFDPHGKTFCGGTLIAPQYVLTAGHCIKTDKGQIYVSIGSEFGSGAGSGSSEVIKVAKGFRHPLYNKEKHLYDVGLLKLEVSSTQKVAPLCASDGSDNKVGMVATVLGWGLTENRVGSFTLQEVNVVIISNVECNNEYGGNRITDGMMCAGNGHGKDSCNGDSGGPLLVNDVLVGLVSWGGKCGAKAGVYTRLTYVLDYIHDVLNGSTSSVFPSSASKANLMIRVPSAAKVTREAKSTAKETPVNKGMINVSPLPASRSSNRSPSLTSATQREVFDTHIMSVTTQPSSLSPHRTGIGCNVRRRQQN
ncbi:unnamed protein product [Phytophthora fragariaefolia]|uniref:Unnamed protein product n=1 Tax=Phytophthora fragariaefolia TaxID=1490495 RepID=A0A9W6XUE2_9STRA|nr:unnamed protein product [Phytophthora fragariaefolia]